MKKLVALFLVFLMAITPFFSLAEEAADTSEETGSKFEQALLKKGSLIIKEFITAGSIKTLNSGITLQTATITDVETGSKYYALRMEHRYYNSQYDNGTSIGVLDSDEIDGAITTLEYIKAHQSELKNYTEITYTASSGLELGAYKNASESYVYIKFSSRDTEFIELSNVDSVISALQKAQSNLGK